MLSTELWETTYRGEDESGTFDGKLKSHAMFTCPAYYIID